MEIKYWLVQGPSKKAVGSLFMSLRSTVIVIVQLEFPLITQSTISELLGVAFGTFYERKIELLLLHVVSL